MPNRYFSSAAYRYGFGGQEMDNEVNGVTGSSYTAEYWQYDSRLGRRWNRDPVVYAWQSTYAAFNNNPIVYNDPSGAEGEDKTKEAKTKNDNTKAGKTKDGDTYTDEKGAESVYSDKLGGWVPKEGGDGATAKTEQALGKEVSLKAGNTEPGFWKIATVSLLSAANAFTTNHAGGAGRANPNTWNHPSLVAAAESGQMVGDLGGMVAGFAEIIIGTGGEVGGIALDVTVVGAPAGAAVGVASTALIVEGVVTVVTSSGNVADGITKMWDRANGNPSSNGSGSSVSKGSGNIDNGVEVPRGFNETKDFGKSNGQKVYKKGEKYISRDIGQKNKTSHNGGVWKEFKKVGNKLKRTGTLDGNLKRMKK